jgi:SH3-like domain-containing protein
MPWAKDEAQQPIPLLERAGDQADVVARLQPGVIANVKDCTGAWCRVVIVLDGRSDVEGFIRQEKLWGVYPDERIE